MAQPIAPPRLLTVDEYYALGETEQGYDELVEGRVVTSPSPVPAHSIASSELWLQLRNQIPAPLVAAQDVDVDLQLAPSGAPGFVRRPDIVVVPQDSVARVGHHGGLIRAAEVIIAIEFVSPGSRRTDHVIKRGEYADAGIPHYWIVDLADPVTLLACHLAGEFGPVTSICGDGGTVTGTFSATEPFAVELDLDALG